MLQYMCSEYTLCTVPVMEGCLEYDQVAGISSVSLNLHVRV